MNQENIRFLREDYLESNFLNEGIPCDMEFLFFNQFIHQIYDIKMYYTNKKIIDYM